jgi:hypothetical protein
MTEVVAYAESASDIFLTILGSFNCRWKVVLVDTKHSIIVELPNGCKITAMGAKADALIAKLLQ